MRLKKRFREFWCFTRYEASMQFLRGNAAPLAAITAQEAVLFDPRRQLHYGYAAVVEANNKAATLYDKVEWNHFLTDYSKVFRRQKRAEWVGIQRARARLAATGEWVEFEFFVVEHFTYEGGDWKLLLRFTSPIAEA
jgi:hypothetical protein